MAWMTIGEFASRTRLSPKALRIYADLGLVVPAEVDPASGYRRYDESQLERARLVALLRGLDMPLADVAGVIDRDPAEGAGLLARWWERAEAAMADRRALVAYIQSRLAVQQGKQGKQEPLMKDISVRAIPERKVASISRHVTLAGAGAFFAEAFPRLRAVAPGMTGIEGVPFVVYYGEVSADSDGPVELCRPVAMDTPEGAVTGSPDIQVRVEPAHEEAYIRLSVAEMAWPRMLPFADALERWGRDHDRRPAAPLRQVLFADLRTASPDTQACDLSVPLRSPS
jgi:DNA-binding transcriptional MerR regulator